MTLSIIYGYNIDDREITINEEAEIVRIIFDDYLNGMGTTSIAIKVPYPFTSKLICENCGKKYRRKLSHGRVYWVCSTYTRHGKDYCNSRQIPEEILLEITSEVLEVDNFDETLFNEKIEHIEICDSNILKFIFRDGEIIQKTWEHKPRSKSWDEEARQGARERALKLYKPY